MFQQSFLLNSKVFCSTILNLLDKFYLFFFFLDLFEGLVPLSVQQALVAYDVRKAELVNSEIGKLRESTQMLNGYKI